MFRSTVICKGLKDGETAEAVADMLSEFAQRPWHQAVTCEWQAGILRLSSQSEGDRTGMALLDEFQDAVVAYINFSGNLSFAVESCVAL
jgi:hypothetical protein